jgi:hypothetical protein
MSLLINNDLIWISIPKNASYSVESALLNSNLKVKLSNGYKKKYIDKTKFELTHTHIPLSSLFDEFGKKETLCINREYSQRWISSLSQILKQLKLLDMNLIIDWKDIDNEFIYNFFDNETIKDINCNENEINYLKKLVSNNSIEHKDFEQIQFKMLWNLLVSQNYWKLNNKCTYEFDINEMDNFETFIKNRYGVNIKVPKLNEGLGYKISDSNIKLDEKLKNWIWENFEVPFVKSNSLI